MLIRCLLKSIPVGIILGFAALGISDYIQFEATQVLVLIGVGSAVLAYSASQE